MTALAAGLGQTRCGWTFRATLVTRHEWTRLEEMTRPCGICWPGAAKLLEEGDRPEPAPLVSGGG